jgi:ribosomal protein S18 acetylase RimI-like enzyme
MMFQELMESDIDTVISLATQIWLSHYVPIIGRAQVDYMLASRFTAENLRRYIRAADRWLELSKLDGEAVGYCSYALTDSPGELKLEQLYLLPRLHGQGLGGKMLRHVEARAQALGCKTMMLTVNKRNAGSIAVYRKRGFSVREEAVFDIGQGYVMDDYVMEKRLA